MIKDFELKGRFIFSKKMFGLGILLEFDPVSSVCKSNWLLRADFFWFRFWIESIKKHY